MTLDTNSLKKVTSPKLAELVARQLTDLIASSELEPGRQLPPEHELVKRFGVARSVVREALVRLQALGIVETRQGKGAFVAPLPLDLLLNRIRRLDETARELLPHVWELREILETAIAELAAQRRTEKDLADLERAVRKMDDALARAELGIPEDAQFHRFLTQATQNPALARIMADLSALIEPSREESLRRPGRPNSSNAEHRAILEAVRARDGDRARERMREHMLFGKRLTSES